MRQLKKDIFNQGEVETEAYQKAVYFYIFNRLAFQGITYHDYIEAFTERDGDLYKKEGKSKVFMYDRWEQDGGVDIVVRQADCVESLLAHPEIFAYLDPPFFSSEGMFGKSKQIFDHHELSETLKARDNWILSSGHVPKCRI